jgi:tRNA G10  N-methylase Trm11
MYLLLGNSSDLAVAEVTAIARYLKLSTPTVVGQRFCYIEEKIDPQAIIKLSGGVVKIYEPVNVENGLIVQAIARDLIQDKQAHFALSSTQKKTPLNTIAADIKSELVAHGIKPHFRILDNILNSAGIVSKSNEYLLSIDTDVPVILKAVAAQDLYHWTAKDYDRPKVDPKSGMLPPKIARMMVNLGLPVNADQNTIIYDPFCGSGTIVVEAMDMGCQGQGSDISEKAVLFTESNCSWFVKEFAPTGKFNIFLADANHLDNTLIPQQVDTIVFEGYLGPPFPEVSKVSNIVKGLEKMYRGVFKHLYPFLKPNGKIVCALPEFVIENGVKNLDKVIDWTESLGYTRLGRFTYGRPQAVVKRAIYVLQKTV